MQLKVWSGRFESGKLLIGAYDKKQAIKISGIEENNFDENFCQSYIAKEINIATEVGVWMTTTPVDFFAKYTRIK